MNKDIDIENTNNYFENILSYAQSAMKSDNKRIRKSLMENIKASAEEFLNRNDI